MALRTGFLLCSLLVALGSPARAQDAPASEPPAIPSWIVRSTPLAPGWHVSAADANTVTLSGDDAQLQISRQAGAAPAALAALRTKLVDGVGGTATPYRASLAGVWALGTRAVGEREQGLVFARSLSDGQALTAIVRGPKRGVGVGVAVETLAELRVQGEKAPAPFPPLDLSKRPLARLNPVGLFIPLPDGWRPKLKKGKSAYFEIKGKPAHVRMAKADSADIRELKSAETVAKRFPGWLVQPVLWRAPGDYRSWQLLQVKGGDSDQVTALKEIHLIRFKKLGDWRYHTVSVDHVDPARGLAPVRSVQSKIGIIP